MNVKFEEYPVHTISIRSSYRLGLIVITDAPVKLIEVICRIKISAMDQTGFGIDSDYLGAEEPGASLFVKRLVPAG